MSIQDWGSIGEVIGAIAVLATLIYLSLQIRHSLQMQRVQTRLQLASGRSQSLRMIVENHELRSAINQAADKRPLNEDEVGILRWFSVLLMRDLENDLHLHELGMIDDEALRIQRTLVRTPHIQIDWLARVKGTFSPAAQAEIDALVAASKDVEITQ